MCIIIGFHTGLAGGMQNAVQTGNKGFDWAALCMSKSIFQPPFTCSKVKMETLEQCGKSVQSWQQRHQKDVIDIVLVSVLLTLNRFHKFFWWFHWWYWTSKRCFGKSIIGKSYRRIIYFENIHLPSIKLPLVSFYTPCKHEKTRSFL